MLMINLTSAMFRDVLMTGLTSLELFKDFDTRNETKRNEEDEMDVVGKQRKQRRGSVR